MAVSIPHVIIEILSDGYGVSKKKHKTASILTDGYYPLAAFGGSGGKGGHLDSEEAEFLEIMEILILSGVLD